MTTNQIEFNIAPVAECSVLVTLTLSPSNNQSS
ncbi:MAG TPA: allophanate hydrolase, partial [Vibrio sp.]|nr:allophanate hydrolase [Vibrio sp.]